VLYIIYFPLVAWNTSESSGLLRSKICELFTFSPQEDSSL
jgi:hypothetical protein